MDKAINSNQYKNKDCLYTHVFHDVSQLFNMDGSAEMNQKITIEHDIIHYTKEKIKLLKPIDFDSLEEPLMKPEGLWVSIEDGWGWKEWCKDSNFALDHFEYAYKIHLMNDANILHLKTAKEVFAFGEEFRCKKFPGFPDDPEFKRLLEYSVLYIDWKKIAQQYQGLIIAPYQWDCRLDHKSSWYWGWDCSSGCIWDIEAIHGLRKLA